MKIAKLLGSGLMPFFERKSRIEVPVKELFNWHNRSHTFDRLSPPWEKIKIIEKSDGITKGNRTVLEVRQGPFRRRWVAIHGEYVEGEQFVDEQVQGPFTKWVHTHQCLPETDSTSFLLDHIDYEMPLGFVGQFMAGKYITKRLDRAFTFRHVRTQNDLKRYHPYAQQKPLKIIVGGASGMIGTPLAHFLSCAGNQLNTLVRRAPRPGTQEIFWDPSHQELDKTSLESVDAVIHLGGENIGASRWTPKRKEAILKSRVESTRFLSEILASLKHPPKVLLVASAIGFYGDRSDEQLTEESTAGKGFLSEVCQAWESAAEPARKAGIRVVHVRTGIVLTSGGGALAQMLTPFRLGLGGKIGTGRQWMSWISLEDAIGVYHYLLHNQNLSGPVNATAPEALPNSEFTKILAKALKRPALFPLPSKIVKLLFGEMGQELLLEGQRVQPQKLTEDGFHFLYPGLEQALRWELGYFS